MLNQYQNLKVWQTSRILVKDIYLLVADFPKNEQFWLVDQMKRAVISIPSNIAEWNTREWIKEQIHFLSIARGSCAELETQVILSVDLGFMSEEKGNKIQSHITEILKMLFSLMKHKKGLPSMSKDQTLKTKD